MRSLEKRLLAVVSSSRFGKFIRFCIVGGCGAIVNLTLLYLLTSNGIHYLVSGAVAIEIAFIFNFFGNRIWTFREVEMNGFNETVRALAGDHGVRSVGMVINIVVLFVLTDILGIFYLLSQLAGACVAVIWNFVGNLQWIWEF